MAARCLSTLEPLDREGLSAEAMRRLSGEAGPFPHRLAHARADLLSFVARVLDRMSVSGVQEKVSLRLVDGELVPTDVGGGFILKVLGAELPRYSEDVPANEHLTMLIAERAFGIEVPPCALVRLAGDELAYLVKRFDSPRGLKVPQEDFSQLLERSEATHGRGYKYDSSYEELGAALGRFNPAPEQMERLFTRIVASYALSNGDAHLKNFSLYRPDPAGPYVLTPAYDLLCTSLHIPNEARLALDLFRDGFVTRAFERLGFESHACFRELARRLGIEMGRALQLLHPFTRERPIVEELVGRSFLSAGARQDYLARYRDRTAALANGADD